MNLNLTNKQKIYRYKFLKLCMKEIKAVELE